VLFRRAIQLSIRSKQWVESEEKDIRLTVRAASRVIGTRNYPETGFREIWTFAVQVAADFECDRKWQTKRWRSSGSNNRDNSCDHETCKPLEIPSILIEDTFLTPRSTALFLEWVDHARQLAPKSRRSYRMGWKQVCSTPLMGMNLDRISSEDLDSLALASSPAYVQSGTSHIAKTVRQGGGAESDCCGARGSS